MRKIFNLVRCEFIKNYALKNVFLILLILLVSIIGLVELNQLFYYTPQTYDDELSYLEEEYNVYLQIENPTYYDEFMKYDVSLRIERQKLMDTYGFNSSDWQDEILCDLSEYQKEIFVINQILDSDFDEYFSNLVETADDNLTYTGYYDNYVYIVQEFYEDDVDTLKTLIIEKEEMVKKCQDLITENKFYKYLEFMVSKYSGIYSEKNLLFINYLIDQKVEDSHDYRALIYYQYLNVYHDSGYMSLEEFNDYYSFSNYEEYASYKSYVRQQKSLYTEYERKAAILEYAFTHDMKHDLTFSSRWEDINSYNNYITSKIATNLVLCMPVIIMIIVILTSGGIVSREHSKNTDKLLLTSPYKRWEILLSKFIYLILHTYVIFILALIIIMIYSGIKYGFSDLFSPKLVYQNGSVVEVNYLLYTIKDILKCSIPVISFLSIMLCLSTITLSTSLTVGLSTLISIVSLFVWHIIVKLRLAFLAYVPITYFSYGIVIFNPNLETYVEALQYADVRWNMCVIVSLITIVVCYLLSNVVYLKRDIKN